MKHIRPTYPHKLQRSHRGASLLLLFSFLSAGCLVSSQITSLNTEGQQIPVFSGLPTEPRPYVEVVDIELTGSVFTSRKKLQKRLLEKAAEQRCDAVINAEFKTNFIWPQALGIGIQYRE